MKKYLPLEGKPGAQNSTAYAALEYVNTQDI